MKWRYLLVAIFLSMAASLIGCTLNIDQPQGSVFTAMPSAVLETAPVEYVGILDQSRIDPTAWSALHLTGKLFFIAFSADDFTIPPAIRTLDLMTGEIDTVFRAPAGGWIYYISVAPDEKHLVMSYAPPTKSDPDIIRTIYVLPTDGSTAPQVLVSPPTPSDLYIQAQWSPDGKYIYYTHVNYQIPFDDGQISPIHTIYRLSYPDGLVQEVAEHAFWPRLSNDFSKLAFVLNDPLSMNNQLLVADVDGSNPRPIEFAGENPPEIVDAPVFAPDDKSLLFSAPVAEQVLEPDWFARFAGVHIVKAHSVPSDWWRVSVVGGDPTQLTRIQATNLFGSISPDGKYIASLSGDGIFVMDLDGAGLTQLISDKGITGTVCWVP